MKKITWPAMLLALVLLLAACGSDDSEVDSADDTIETAEETTTDDAPESAADENAEDTIEAVEDPTTDGAQAESTADASGGDAATADASGGDAATEDASAEAVGGGAEQKTPGVDEQVGAGDGFIVTNQLGPSTEEQIAEFQQPGPDGPIYMVNLLEFKDFAEYEDGRETDLTGREAYALYTEGMHDVLALFGAEIVFEGDVSFLSIGQVDELWDEVGVVRYPSRATLLEMSSSPEWQAVSVHRTAGLAGQLNIETVDPVAGP
ncbi:MAG: DUF1330 domain-containing protein [Actinomycetota bacterium]